jgi:phospho-N-acetylmuramoyl-pentapeptide-transferase
VGLFTVIGFGALGAYDDWTKLTTHKNGLEARHKLAVQLVLGAIAAGFLYRELASVPHGLDLIWPIGNLGIALGGGFIVWATFVMVGSSNAVNLTDGLDGLASGCTIFAGGAFAALSYLAGHKILAGYLSIPFVPGAGELAIRLGALVGAMLGFLWFNCYPAQVFMGDT